jgi:small subunit ribosomal protein S21
METFNVGINMSRNRTVNVEVTLKEVGGNINRLIRKFMKKVKKERIIEDYLDRRFYEKPSAKRRREKLKKLRNAQKAERERNTKLDIK